MAFIEPMQSEAGVAEMPSRIYGALTYSAHRLDNQPTASDTHRFIPLHNLAHFYRRRLLFPRPGTVSRPLYDHPPQCEEMIAKRYTALDIFEIENEKRFSQKNRNLLSGEAVDSDTVRLWFVDDNSDRQIMSELLFDVEHPKDGHNPLRCDYSENSSVKKAVNLGSDCLELRSYDRADPTGWVFARCSNQLSMWNGDEVTTIYPHPCQFFERIAHMDEVAIIDMDGLVFMGSLDEGSFSRVKCNDAVTSVASTDSPKNLVVASDTKVYIADLRSPLPLTNLFDVHLNRGNFVEPMAGKPENLITKRQRIWHLNSVRPDTELYVITASQRMYVVDRRMPNISLFHMNHFHMKAGEYCAMTEPFHHDKLNVDVYQYFLLGRVCNPQLLHWSIGWNARELVWSSMGHSCAISEPRQILELTRAQPQLGEIHAEYRQRMPQVTRAFHYQHLPNKGHRGLLFRQMNNGQLWYDSMHFSQSEEDDKRKAQPTKMAKPVVSQSIKEINDFFDSHKDQNLVDLDEELNTDVESIMREPNMKEVERNLTKILKSTQKSDPLEEYDVELDDIGELVNRFGRPTNEDVDLNDVEEDGVWHSDEDDELNDFAAKPSKLKHDLTETDPDQF